MSEEVEQNPCADEAQSDNVLVDDMPCSTTGPVRISSVPTDLSEEIKTVRLDDSDDDENGGLDYNVNMGLPYSDHNYDVPDPAKRYKPNPEELKKFETIDGISLTEKTDSAIHSRVTSRDINRHGSLIREVDDRRRSEPSFRLATRKAEYSSTFHEGHSQFSGNRNTSPGNYFIGDGVRAATIRTGTLPKPRTLSTSGVSQGTSSEFLVAPRKIDQPPHRLQEFRHSSVAPTRQSASAPQFNAADPSQAAVANAPAPMLVCGNRNITPRNSRTKRDDSDDSASIGSTILRSPMQSPRKQVHFMDGAVGHTHSPLRGDVRGSMFISTPNSLQRKMPPNKPVPPHRQINISAPNSNVPVRNTPTRPNVPASDPHSFPENIMEDNTKQIQTKVSSDFSLSPNTASIEFTSRLEDANAEMVKAKIASVTKQIELEKLYERPVVDSQVLASAGSEYVPFETIRARGRPRGNINSRTRNSLSNSSGTIGSSSPQSAYATNGSPTKSFNLSYSNPKDIHLRPPGASPTRTNLDFNNHVSSFGSLGNTNNNSRFSYQQGRKVTNKIETPVPVTKGRGRRKQSEIEHEKKYVPEPDIGAKDQDQEHVDDDEDDDAWFTRCVCGLAHGLGLTVCCDRCNSWQHGPCYGINDESSFPEKWLCDICDPRKLPFTTEQALQIQEKLGFHHPIRKGRRASVSNKEVIRKIPTPSRTHKMPNNYSKKYTVIGKNNLSRRARQLLELTPNSGTDLKELSVFLENGATNMIVAPDLEGLVATREVKAGQVIIEYIGNVMLPDERTKEGFQRFCVLYDGLIQSSSSDDSHKDSYICIDASKIGGEGRFARRCCRPNTSIKHSLNNGQLNLYLVANESIADGTEITIPFDIDTAVNDMRENCWCKQHASIDGDRCLFLQPGNNYVLGHRNIKDSDNTAEDEKKGDKRGRPKGRGRKSKQELKPLVEVESPRSVKEEKSEEEVSNILPTAVETVNVSDSKKDSDKEEKEELILTRSTRKSAAKEMDKSDVNYTLPADRNKPSREDKKIQAQLAFMETNKAKKIEVKSAEKRKSTGKNGFESPTRRRSKKEDDPELVTSPVVKREEDMEINKTPTLRKRLSEKEKTGSENTSAPLFALSTPKEIPFSSAPGKKQWLRRHAAQTVENAAAKTVVNVLPVTPTTSNSPQKRRRTTRFSCSEEAKSETQDSTNSPELRAQLQSSATVVLKKLGETPFELPNSTDGVPTTSHKDGSVTEELTDFKLEEDDSKSKVEELPQKTSKRLSLEDYRKLRPRVTSGELGHSPRTEQRGFIPSMDNLANQTTLMPITLPEPAKSVDALKKDIYGEIATPTEEATLPQPSSKLRLLQRPSKAAEEEQPKPPPRPSIADRLAVEFGLGFSPKKQDNEVPPITQLPVCPPPVSRREQSSTNVQLNRATTRKSRW